MGQSGTEFIIHLFEVSHLLCGTDGLIRGDLITPMLELPGWKEPTRDRKQHTAIIISRVPLKTG